MTTAHKPTWHSARGGTGQGGNVMGKYQHSPILWNILIEI